MSSSTSKLSERADALMIVASEVRSPFAKPRIVSGSGKFLMGALIIWWMRLSDGTPPQSLERSTLERPPRCSVTSSLSVGLVFLILRF